MLTDPLIRTPIAISLGAIAGALSRYYLSAWVSDRLGTSFPYGTLVVNVTGCFGMGVISTLGAERLAPDLRFMLTTGFLGAYTTFSTYSLETVTLMHTQQLTLAGLYGLGSAIVGAIAVQLGSWVARLSG